MFEFNAPIDTAQMGAIATGHAQTLERWGKGPNGRRSTGQPLIDEDSGAPVRIYDVMLPTGRDGRPELHGVRVISNEVPPELAPIAPATSPAPAPRGGKCPSRAGTASDGAYTCSAATSQAVDQ